MTAAPSSPRPRLDSLTGLRFFAALSVFLFHASLQKPANSVFDTGGIADAFTTAARYAGGLGVTFFFVLSGVVMAYIDRPGEPKGAFWRRRLVKIFPNHIVTWAIALVLFAAATTTVAQASVNVTLLQTWVPDYATFLSVNPPSWSLSTELFFYLCCPFVYVLIRRLPDRALWPALAAAVGAVGVSVALAYVLFPSSPHTPDDLPLSELQYWFGYVFPPSRLFDFVAGLVLGTILVRGRWRQVPIAVVLAAFPAFYALSYATPYLVGVRLTMLVPVVLLIGTVAHGDLKGRSSLLRGRRMQWLGEISFGFYLVHALVLVEGRKLLGPRTFEAPAAIGVELLYLAVSVAAGAALYTFVEKPAYARWSRRRARPEAAVSPSPSAPPGSHVPAPVARSETVA
ncbi:MULTISPECIES: acyltransferase family protein [Tsukamurella]|uniref:Acyltransferase n=3 Tax=Tsukamurella TaxID=2060 RepID=A0A5C5RYC4_9ACTN|nr:MULTISPECIES: acyltransferase [Tsukamurella]NMD56571.1 acyltransferase [Tsukamurella columbiensis]TWS27498.1 acyltransferase [Tsukamurella conjunctivitidis]